MKLVDAQTEYVRSVLSAHNVARHEAWTLPKLWTVFNTLPLDNVVTFEAWLIRMQIQIDAPDQQQTQGETIPMPEELKGPVTDDEIRRHNEAEIMKLQMLVGKDTPLTVKIDKDNVLNADQWTKAS